MFYYPQPGDKNNMWQLKGWNFYFHSMSLNSTSIHGLLGCSYFFCFIDGFFRLWLCVVSCSCYVYIVLCLCNEGAQGAVASLLSNCRSMYCLDTINNCRRGDVNDDKNEFFSKKVSACCGDVCWNDFVVILVSCFCMWFSSKCFIWNCCFAFCFTVFF